MDSSDKPTALTDRTNAIKKKLFWAIQITDRLHQTMMLHRWNEATELLMAFIQRKVTSVLRVVPPRLVNLIVWRIGTEILAHAESPDALHKLIEQLKTGYILLPEAEEISLLYIMHLMSHGKFYEAHEVFKTAKSANARANQVRNEPRIENVGLILTGCQGLLDYVMWLEQREELVRVSTSESFVYSTSEDQLTESVVKHANAAIASFSKLTNYTGNWDIFVVKLLELLQDDLDQAADLVHGYINNNPANPNAYKYLFEILLQKNADVDELMSVLRDLVSLVPSHRLSMQLAKLTDDVVEKLQLLFSMLDYSVWQDVEAPWRMLADVLLTVEKRSDLDDVWNKRQAWWPSYHFTEFHAKTDKIGPCLSCKVATALLLCGPGNEFVNLANTRLVNDELHQLRMDKTRTCLNSWSFVF